jgi:hypothetical protein
MAVFSHTDLNCQRALARATATVLRGRRDNPLFQRITAGLFEKLTVRSPSIDRLK